MKQIKSNSDTDNGIRLQVWLARSGVSSRRSAVELVTNGRVRVNQKVVCEPGWRVQSTDDVSVDGRPVSPAAHNVYYILHKPAKYLCSTADDDHRDLVLDLIQPFVKERLFTVGRLDYMTSGLLLLTNDGEWARKLAHPSSHVEKEYLVQTKKAVPVELLENFKAGIRIEGERFQCVSYQLLGPHSVQLTLAEGKNREIRKVFQSQNITVKRVHRLRFGSITLRGLVPGRFRKLTDQELRSLNATIV